ncbi:MAG: hypothetical protein J6B64_02015 [Bacilli bacterium]|nr:hypothetical protein [Bacilli bacterium]MBP3921332.1 hypothetical protein [Bacilli bacterium]
MTKYIDSKTYEIIENPDFFEVDDEIAEAIVILNKKGYKTKYSCAGHNKSGWLYPTQEEPFEFCEEWLKQYNDDVSTKYLGNDNKFFYHKDEITATYTYVSFEKKYNFEKLPEGFEIDEENKYFAIGKFCYFYKSNNTKHKSNKKSDFEIKEELMKTQQELLNWAKTLKSII